MPVNSMTGFGRGDASVHGVHAVAELSSVNRKHLEVSITLPSGLSSIEPEITALVRRSVSRGHIRGGVSIRVKGKAVLNLARVDVDLARAYMAKMSSAARKLGLEDNIRLKDVMRMPGVVSQADPSALGADVCAVVVRAISQALRSLMRMRRIEGRRLWSDITARLRRLDACCSRIRALVPGMVSRQRRLAIERVRGLGAGSEITSSVARELSQLLDKGDVTEELVRIGSHLAQALSLRTSPEPAGRIMEFLCQELLREINTVGSKTADIAVSRAVLEFKSTLDAVREQVQNVE